MTDTITSLIEKLEGAEVGSGELDDSVWIAAVNGEMMDWWDDDAQQYQIRAENGSRVNVTPVTTSLDAALALAERLELSVGEILNDALEGPAGVGIWQSGWNGTISTIPQIARFVCIAILRAQSEARR